MKYIFIKIDIVKKKDWCSRRNKRLKVEGEEEWDRQKDYLRLQLQL